MEERRNELLSAAVISILKAMPLTAEYEQQPDGKIFGKVKEFRGTGYASTKAECVRLMVEDMRDWAEAFIKERRNTPLRYGKIY